MKVYIKKSSSANFEHIDIKDTPLGKGGQGAVHNITTAAYSAEYCIKIYIKEPEKSFEKIRYMVEHQPQNINTNPSFRICWPTALVYDTNKKFIGYMMPLAFPKGHDLTILSVYQRRPLAQIKRYQKYTEWHGKYELDSPIGIQNRIKMLCNVAIALHCIHATGKYVLVDLKPENIDATGTGKVSIMDTDSIQISEGGRILHPATAFTPDYFAPEGKGIQSKGLPFPVECDYFAAAVCFYQILTGTHPYAGTVLKPPYDNCNELAECIANGLFAFGDKQKYISLPKGFNLQQNFFNLPLPVQELFKRAFGSNPKSRPSMEEWGKTFFGLIKNNIKVGASTVKRDTSSAIPIKITGVQFSDEDHNGKIIRSVGSKLYNDVSYLCPHITYQVISAVGKVDVHYKIISPEGSSSTNDNTFGTINLTSSGTHTSSLGGWGSDKKTSYKKPGDWTIEFYYKGKCIYRTKFTIYQLGASTTSTPTPRTTTTTTTTTPSGVPIRITDVQFCDQDYDGNILRQYGTKMYTDTSFLCPKISYTANRAGTFEVDMKIISPTGSVFRSSNPNGMFTRKLNPTGAGNFYANCYGVGGKNKESYSTPGSWRVEFYYNGSCIYTTSVEIHKKSAFSGFAPSSSRASSYSSGGLFSKINSKIKSLGEWIDDNRDDWADEDLWEKIFKIGGGILLALIALGGPDTLIGKAAVLLIGGGIGYFLAPLIGVALSYVAAIFLYGVRYIFYNMWTLLLTLLVIIGPSVADNLDISLGDIKSKINISSTKTSDSDQSIYYYCISKDVLNVRKEPRADAKVIGVLQPGEKVKVYTTKNGFVKIKFHGGIGYASEQYLSKTKPTK